MQKRDSFTSGSHRGLFATAVAGVLLLAGVGLVGIALASQERVAEVHHDAVPALTVPATETADSRVRGSAAHPATDEAEIGQVEVLSRSKPVRLDIPAIGVRSAMREIGLSEVGALDGPPPGPDYDKAAWYRDSPAPGSLGPAVVLGHVDSAANGPSVFFRLGELKKGDEISVARADGSIALFVVDEVRSYPKDDFPTQLVYGDIDHAGLRLITCGGSFDSSSGHYKDNIVVYASLTSRP